jgi:uncharacterized membrane protein
MDRTLWSRIFLVLGLFGMLVGALDPLEGCVVITPAAGVAGLGAMAGRTRLRRLVYIGFAMVVVGVAAMILLSLPGVVHFRETHSRWWLLTVAPYPAGWVLGLVAGVLSLIESFRRD